MLTTVIIILREVLEAALLISILLVLNIRLRFSRYWLLAAVIAGVAGAALYASQLQAISMWRDGTGQELVNGVSLLLISLCLAYEVLHISKHNSSHPRLLTPAAIAIIVLAFTREGAEIIVYFSTASLYPEKLNSMAIGGIIGAGLGICLGILCFVLLSQLTRHNLVIATSIILVLMTAGLMAEGMQSAIQAGLLITDEPIWDTSSVIHESSVAGQLLYAVFSYESSPTLEEVIAWMSTVILLSASAAWRYSIHHNPRAI